jgi:hypothetical protein
MSILASLYLAGVVSWFQCAVVSRFQLVKGGDSNSELSKWIYPLSVTCDSY